jgi:hypothetical protein
MRRIDAPWARRDAGLRAARFVLTNADHANHGGDVVPGKLR